MRVGLRIGVGTSMRLGRAVLASWPWPTPRRWNTKRNKGSFDPRGTLWARQRQRQQQQESSRFLIGSPEEYVHGHTLSIMLTQTTNSPSIDSAQTVGSEMMLLMRQAVPELRQSVAQFHLGRSMSTSVGLGADQSKRTGLLAVKCGMTSEWDSWGERHPLTVLKASQYVPIGG